MGVQVLWFPRKFRTVNAFELDIENFMLMKTFDVSFVFTAMTCLITNMIVQFG